MLALAGHWVPHDPKPIPSHPIQVFKVLVASWWGESVFQLPLRLKHTFAGLGLFFRLIGLSKPFPSKHK